MEILRELRFHFNSDGTMMHQGVARLETYASVDRRTVDDRVGKAALEVFDIRGTEPVFGRNVPADVVASAKAAMTELKKRYPVKEPSSAPD